MNEHHECFPERWYTNPPSGYDQTLTIRYRERPCRKIWMCHLKHTWWHHPQNPRQHQPPLLPSPEEVTADNRLHMDGKCSLCRRLAALGRSNKALEAFPRYNAEQTFVQLASHIKRPCNNGRTRKKVRTSTEHAPRIAAHAAIAGVR